MLNQTILVGRLTKDIQLNQSEEGKKVATMNIAVPRSYKNAEGVYETDFIDVTLMGSVAENIAKYCQKGDIVGLKARIQRIDSTSELQLIADKVSFLSKAKNHDEEINEEVEESKNEELEM